MTKGKPKPTVKATIKQRNNAIATFAPSIKQLHEKKPKEAVKLLKKHLKNELKQNVENFPEIMDDIEIFLEELMKASNDWGSKEDLLVLYTRWAKKVSQHFHTDTVAVMKCVLNRENEKQPRHFNKLHHVLENRNLHYQPPTKKRDGSQFGHRIKFSNQKVSKKDLKAELLAQKKKKKGKQNEETFDDSLDSKLESIPSAAMKGLAHQVGMLTSGIANSAMGKIGYRRQNPGISLSTRHLDIGEDVTEDAIILSLQNLLEYHLPETFLRRVTDRIDHRCLAFWLFETIFQGKGKHNVLNKSVQFTDNCTDRHEFLCMLAGLALVFPDLQSASKNQTDALWAGDIEVLKRLAVEAYKQQITQELLPSNPKEITSTLCALNSIPGEFSYNGTTSNRTQRSSEAAEKRFLLVRAVIFEKWLMSERPHMIKLREHVLEQMKLRDLPDDDSSESSQEEKDDHASTSKLPLHPATPGPQTFDGRTRKKNPRKRLLGRPTSDRKSKNEISIYAPSKRSRISVCPFSTKNPNPSAHHSPPLPREVQLHSLSRDDWKGLELRFPDQGELDSLCSSYFLVEKGDGSAILLKTTPKEFYSADSLRDLEHLRDTGPPGYVPSPAASKVEYLNTSFSKHVDPKNLLYVVRDDDSLFQKYSKLILEHDDEMERLIALAEAVAVHGRPDTNRSNPNTSTNQSHQRRVDIQCVGRNFKDPNNINDQGFFEKIQNDDRFKHRNIEETIGDLSFFAWCLMAETELRNTGLNLAPDQLRNDRFGKMMREHLGIGDEFFNAESVTLVVGVLYPNYDGVVKHRDYKNDWRPGYTRTGVYNMILMSADNKVAIHIQIILNFRKAVGDIVRPEMEGVKECVEKIQHYLKLVDDDYKSSFSDAASGSGVSPPSPLDHSNFRLSNSLPFEKEKLWNTDNIMQCFFPMISPSRIRSYSMFIEPLVELRTILNRRQLLGLEFLAALYGNPLHYNYKLMELIERNGNKDDPFQFSNHPIYDLVDSITETFDGQWQSGQRNRYSCVGGRDDQVPRMFGFGKYKENRDSGIALLEQMLDVFEEHCEWIDDQVGKGVDPVVDLPLSYVQAHFDEMKKRLDAIAQCQFGIFRWGVFTTILIGTGTLRPGPHLRQLALPAEGCASLKHLRMAKIPPDQYDVAMQMIAGALGIPYHRDIIETLLCESLGRLGLTNKVYDWYRRGGTIFDIDDSGNILRRAYGEHSAWVLLCQVGDKLNESDNLAELDSISLPPIEEMEGSTQTTRPPMLFEEQTGLVENLFKEINQLISPEGNSSSRTRFQKGQEYTKRTMASGVDFVDAFCVSEAASSCLKNTSRFHILDDGPTTVRADSVLPLGSQFNSLFDYFKERGFSFGMMAVHKSRPSSDLCVFSAHRDKSCFQEGVGFLPVATSFWTVCEFQQTEDSFDDNFRFQNWSRVQPTEDQVKIVDFLMSFGIRKREAFQFVKKEKTFNKFPLSIFKCEPGSALCFRGEVKHGTIVPKCTVERHLLIFTEAVKAN